MYFKSLFAIVVAVLVVSVGCGTSAKQNVSSDAQLSQYPLTTCVVTDEALGDHGKPIDHVYEGRLVRFCCKGCIDDFNKDPKKYLAKLDAAAAARTPAKP